MTDRLKDLDPLVIEVASDELRELLKTMPPFEAIVAFRKRHVDKGIWYLPEVTQLMDRVKPRWR